MKKHELKRQKAPKLKVGQVLFRFVGDSWDDGSTSVDAQEWIVRSIRKKSGSQSRYGRKALGYNAGGFYDIPYVHLAQKCKQTWGKLSTKQFHRGFFKSIPDRFRESFRQSEDAQLPDGIFTTRLAAINYAVKDSENNILRYDENIKKDPDDEDWAEFRDDSKKELRLLKSRQKKIKKELKK